MVAEILEEEILKKGREERLDFQEKVRLHKEIFNTLRRLDVLQELLEDDSVTEIMINGPSDIFIEKQGEIIPWSRQFESKEKLEDVIQQIVSASNRMVNESNPIVDVRLKGGFRVNVVLQPIALEAGSDHP